MSEKLDIASAPTDGTRIVGIDEQRGYVGVMAFLRGEWECVGFTGERLGIGFYPTHWLPIPAPENERIS